MARGVRGRDEELQAALRGGQQPPGRSHRPALAQDDALAQGQGAAEAAAVMNAIVAIVAISFVVMMTTTTTVAAPRPERAAWLRDARWGVMTHYLPDWIERKQWTPGEFNQLIDNFD